MYGEKNDKIVWFFNIIFRAMNSVLLFGFPWLVPSLASDYIIKIFEPVLKRTFILVSPFFKNKFMFICHASFLPCLLLYFIPFNFISIHTQPVFSLNQGFYPILIYLNLLFPSPKFNVFPHFLCASCCSKCFTHVNSFNSQSSSLSQMLLLNLF